MIRSDSTYSESENVFLSSLGNFEEQSKISVSWYDFGARNYDPSLGMWFNMDPLAERYHISSPYHFVANNPVNNIELNGAAFAYRHIDPFTGMFDDGSGGGGSGGGYRRVGRVYYNSEGHSVPFWEVFFNYIKPNSVILTRSEKQNLVSRNRGGSGSSGGYIVNIEGVAKWVAKNLGIRISKSINISYSTSSFSLNNISMYGMSMSASLFGGGLPQDPNLMPDPSVNDGIRIEDAGRPCPIDLSLTDDEIVSGLLFHFEYINKHKPDGLHMSDIIKPSSKHSNGKAKDYWNEFWGSMYSTQHGVGNFNGIKIQWLVAYGASYKFDYLQGPAPDTKDGGSFIYQFKLYGKNLADPRIILSVDSFEDHLKMLELLGL